DAGHRFDVDGAADLVDIVAHDVHANAAAGYAGDLDGGGKAGGEDEFVNLRLGELGDLLFRGQPLGNGLGLDPLGIEPAPVVGDLHDDEAAFVIGGQADAPALGLAGDAALV